MLLNPCMGGLYEMLAGLFINFFLMLSIIIVYEQVSELSPNYLQWTQNSLINEAAFWPVIVLLVILIVIFVFLIYELALDLLDQGAFVWLREAIGYYV